MQDKIDKLTDLINNLKSSSQKNFALRLLSDIIVIINNMEKEINNLYTRKLDIQVGEGNHELDKYILALIVYGFTQDTFKNIDLEIFQFVANNKNDLKKLPEAKDYYNIQNWYRSFILENENRKPQSFKELKSFIDAAVKA